MKNAAAQVLEASASAAAAEALKAAGCGHSHIRDFININDQCILNEIMGVE